MTRDTLFERVAITGIAETRYIQGSTKSGMALSMLAARDAIREAGLEPKQIDGIIPMVRSAAIAEDYITNLGMDDIRFSAHTPLGGASCVAALQAAALAINAGVCRHVLIPVGRSGFSGPRTTGRLSVSPPFNLVKEFEFPLGSVAPGQFYAYMARRHMELYGTTSRDFAEVAVTMRRHAALNANAIKTAPISVEDHQNSRMICEPFRLLDCCIESDGGAAIVVSDAALARDMPNRPVYLMSVGEGHPNSPSAISQRPDLTSLGVAKAAARTFDRAGISPSDINVAQLYDGFTYLVICQLEDLGFCRKGEGGAFVRDGNIGLNGRLPINTHGGLLSQAHMSGMNHICELVRQLRSEAGPAQVANAQVGLVTGFGDHGDGAMAILRGGM